MHEKIGCGALILTTRYDGAEHPFFEQVDAQPRILLTRRGFRAPTFPGAWACPAGLLEKDELLTDAVAREVHEEVGLTFKPEAEPFYSGTWEDRQLNYFLGTWAFEFKEGVRLVDGEAIGFDWCTYEEAVSLDLGFRYREALEGLLEQGFL